jgi:hypothetical protein
MRDHINNHSKPGKIIIFTSKCSAFQKVDTSCEIAVTRSTWIDYETTIIIIIIIINLIRQP